jgi:rRNA maturation endonuclease Nob1
MGILDDAFQSVKSNLKWKAQSEVNSGIEKGIRSVISKFKNRCPKCGKPVTEEGAKFCPNCRANLILTCSNPDCRHTLPLGTKFCPSCGTELKLSKASEPQAPETKSPEST